MATEIISKRCSHCKQIKLLSEFYKDRNVKDGRRNCCKSCMKDYQKAYQQSKIGKAVDCKAGAKYKRTSKGKAVQHKATAKFSARHPNQIKAVGAVNDAIKAGKLSRPDAMRCHYCSEPAKVYHHHLGYEPEHWLDVIPLCLECHIKAHVKNAKFI